MEAYLKNCCDTHQWMGCVVVGGDGLLLASVGHGLDDGCTALLPDWLSAGEGIAMQGDLNGMTCCCMMPKNQSAMILAWSVNVKQAGTLYFAIRTRHIPRSVISVLEGIGKDVRQMLYPE
ncbi:MAG: hypothetical protein COA61_002440 [Zetaproteobacteria bacterium]|nr:hypothetical protein [Zetaproteobacteria bacterium]